MSKHGLPDFHPETTLKSSSPFRFPLKHTLPISTSKRSLERSLSPIGQPFDVITATTTTTTTTTTTLTANIPLAGDKLEVVLNGGKDIRQNSVGKKDPNLNLNNNANLNNLNGLNGNINMNSNINNTNGNLNVLNANCGLKGKVKPKGSFANGASGNVQNLEKAKICNNKHSNSGHTAITKPVQIDVKPMEITFTVSRAPNENFKPRRVKDMELPNHEPTKFSFKKNGYVKAYAVNTNQGIVRNYNEDRVSIVLNIMQPLDRQNEFWPRCSFFGVYDGHGGVGCADYLRDNLHNYVVKQPSFPSDPIQALKGGFQYAEEQFLEYCQDGKVERSGSCCIVCLIVGDMCYVANVGDSRSVLSCEDGLKALNLSRDHKPMDEIEYKRIIEAGGKIYQTKVQTTLTVGDPSNEGNYVLGPYRVLPGRLSVTRTFGDIEAKHEILGGNPNVVVAIPDISAFRITNEHDFVIMASDGIYDKMESKDVVEAVWASVRDSPGDNIHQACATAVEHVMKTAIAKRTVDNITVVMISFSRFKNMLFPKERLICHNSLDQIDLNRQQEYVLNNSLMANSFELDNRSFSLGEELNFCASDSEENAPIVFGAKNQAKTQLENSSQRTVKKIIPVKKKAGLNTNITQSIKNLSNTVKSSQLNNTKVLSSKPAVKKPDSAIYTTRKHLDLLPPKKKILS